MVTLVTGLWDIKRGELGEGWSRSFEYYKEKFSQLLQVENNMIIFGESDLELFVWQFRKKENTLFITRNKNWFIGNEYFPLIQEIRNNPDWYNQAGWLKDSTQSKLEMYNPLVMSKMFLLHDAKILDRFNSDYLFWVDAGITNTVHPGYFTHDKVLDKLPDIVSKFSFICFPYEANQEVHGFKYKNLCEIAKAKTNKVARGGFFGGPKESISEVNSIYYSIMNNTLQQGLMGTEESIFTLMVYLYPYIFQYAEIESNGLLGKFFEDLKNNTVTFKSERKTPSKKIFSDKAALYVISYNSPNQFKALLESIKKYDNNFLNKTTKFLLDNSTDRSTFEDYSKICAEYNFEHIKKDNLGICGGRQFIAEHFESTGLDYMFFLEDDMLFYSKEGELCKNGFNRYIKNLYDKILNIMTDEGYDFLKLSFTEFYGNNSTQWAWYNVPRDKREEYWPEYNKLPEHGLDKNSPRTVFKNIKSLQDLPYADGEIYYSNWPQIITKEANKKMFLDTKWAHPFEQTWMSHFFQMTKKGELNPAILLLSPIEHDRFEHYDRNLRKES